MVASERQRIDGREMLAGIGWQREQVDGGVWITACCWCQVDGGVWLTLRMAACGWQHVVGGMWMAASGWRRLAGGK